MSAPLPARSPRGLFRDDLAVVLALVTLAPLTKVLLDGAFASRAILASETTSAVARTALGEGTLGAVLGAIPLMFLASYLAMPSDAPGVELVVAEAARRTPRLGRAPAVTIAVTLCALALLGAWCPADLLNAYSPVARACLAASLLANVLITTLLLTGAARRGVAAEMLAQPRLDGAPWLGVVTLAPSAPTVPLRDAPRREAALLSWSLLEERGSRYGKYTVVHDGGCNAVELPVRLGDAPTTLDLRGASLLLRARDEGFWDEGERARLRELAPLAPSTASTAAVPHHAELALAWALPGDRLWVLADEVDSADEEEAAGDYRTAPAPRRLHARVVVGNGGEALRRELRRARAQMGLGGLAAMIVTVSSAALVAQLALAATR